MSQKFVLIPLRDSDGQVVGNEIKICDSFRDIEEAQEAMRSAGLETTPVWTGDPHGDHLKTGLVLCLKCPGVPCVKLSTAEVEVPGVDWAHVGSDILTDPRIFPQD